MFIICLWLVSVSVIFGGKPPSSCGENYFPCNNGLCIEKGKWCDNEADCMDGSDEWYCFKRSAKIPSPNKCDETLFMCKDGRCIPLVGRYDCYSSCWYYPGCDSTAEVMKQAEIGDKLKLQPEDTVEQSTNSGTGESKEFSVKYHAVSREEIFDEHYLYKNILQPISTHIETMDDIFEEGFVELEARDFQSAREKARKWLLSLRDKDYGWKEETAAAITALHLADTDLVRKDHDNMLMSKQLYLKLFAALIGNRTSPVPLNEFSLFINALSATCDNPRNFHGIDLIKILRHRADVAQASAAFLSPMVYMTLCLNDAIVDSDLRKLQEMYKSPKINKIDIEAQVSLAATCISRMTKFKNYSTGRQAARLLYHKVGREGLPEDICQLSLVTQALNEGRINQDLWNRSESLNRILHHQESNGSFGDILSTYYTMPVLAGKSLLAIGELCKTGRRNGITPFEMFGEEEEIYVTYSLYFGNPVDVSHTLKMKVKKAMNFLDLMRLAETINPVYKFKYDMSQGIPTVYSIGRVVNDPENGVYWQLYVQSQQISPNESDWIPYEGDIRSLILETEDSIVFWRRSL